MTSRLREILTADEMELLERTGSLHEEVVVPVLPRLVLPSSSGSGRTFRDLRIRPLSSTESDLCRYSNDEIFRLSSALFEGVTRGLLGVDPPVLDCKVVGVFDEGYCYLKTIKESEHLSVAARLGEWPDLDSLFSLPCEVYIDKALLASLVWFFHDGKLHVATAEEPSHGGIRMSFLSALMLLPYKAMPDWLRLILDDRECDGEVVPISGQTLVGGVGSAWYEEESLSDYTCEVLFRRDVRGRVMMELGEHAELSRVFSYPAECYVTEVGEVEFSIEEGVVKFSVDTVRGFKVSLLMRMLFDELGDLDGFPVLNAAGFRPLNLRGLGLRLKSASRDANLSGTLRHSVIKEEGVLEKMERWYFFFLQQATGWFASFHCVSKLDVRDAFTWFGLIVCHLGLLYVAFRVAAFVAVFSNPFLMVLAGLVSAVGMVLASGFVSLVLPLQRVR